MIGGEPEARWRSEPRDVDESREKVVDLQTLVGFEVGLVGWAQHRGARVGRPVHAFDRLGELVATGRGGDDLVSGRGTDRGHRGVVAGFGERDDELGAFEVDAESEVLARDLGRDGCRSVGVERTVGEVDEPQRERLGDGGRDVLLADEVLAQEDGGERIAGTARLRDRHLEIVTRQDVAFHQELAQNPLLTPEHPASSLSSALYRQRLPFP